MNIAVIGIGKIGITLVEHLSNENHDVIIIDNNPKTPLYYLILYHNL